MPRLTGPKNVNNQILEQGYTDKPKPQSAKGFKIRSGGYDLDMNKSIDENMVEYVAWLKQQPDRTALFSRAPMLAFFSRNKIKDVIFVIRHPVHQYVSLTKKERHAEFVASYGGMNTKGGIDYWIQEWGRFARDAVESKNAIVRYEFAQEDARIIDLGIADPRPNKVFRNWTTARRNTSVLKPDLEKRLKDAVWDVYSKIYPAWEI
ncbi:MAG: hypothetical protein ACXAC5_00780 [Promethearchaeota archaeon]